MRDPDAADGLVADDRMLVVRLDVTDSASITTAVDSVLARFGQIDVLVNNAGFGAYGPLEATDMATVRRQFDTNVVGLLETTKAVLPHMRRQGSGVLVNVSSVGGRVTFPLGSLYHGTKFAVEGLSESLVYELEPLGIRVKIIEPGGVATNFAGRSFTFSNDESLDEYQPVVQRLMAAQSEAAAGGGGPASEVAETIYAAATDDSNQLRYVYGDDAQQALAARASSDDATFMAGIKASFGI